MCCMYMSWVPLLSGTTIPRWQYRFPSAQRSQASSGPVSTTVGDHVGIPGVVLLLIPMLATNTRTYRYARFLPLAWLIPGCTQRIAIPAGSTVSGLHFTTSTPTVTPYHQSMFFTISCIRVKIRTTMSSEWYPRIHICQKWRQKGQTTHTPFIPHHPVMCSTRQCWVMITGFTIQQRYQPYLLHIPNYQMCHTYYETNWYLACSHRYHILRFIYIGLSITYKTGGLSFPEVW